jgi:uncharacterized repeat protein (TIGR01451 family)
MHARIRSVIISINLALLMGLLAALVVWAAVPTAVTPANRAVDAAGNANVSISYDEAVNPATVDAASFPVYSSLRGRLAGTYDTTGATVIFTPSGTLLPGEAILAVATDGIENGGGAGAGTWSWRFAAASAPGSGNFLKQSGDINPAAAWTRDIAVGDVNGDGWIDVAVANDVEPSIQNIVYLNDGAGGFSGGTKNFGSGVDGTQAVALADMDRDGDLDAVVGNIGGYPNVIYLNDGAGNFTAGQRVFGQSSDGIIDLAVADLDNNGWPDLVAARSGQASKVYTSSGGFFGSGVEVGSASWNTVSVDAGDLDRDGDMDLALGNSSTVYRNVILKNDGAAAFPTPLSFGQNSDDTRVVRFLDADGDGRTDVAMANYGLQNRVYLNDGSGGLLPVPVDFGTGTDHTVALAVADFNGDGYPDIAQGNRDQQNRVYFYDEVLGYTGDSNFGPADDISLSVAAADLDGDGDIDLAAGNYNQQSKFYLNGNFDRYPPTVDKSGIAQAPYTAGSVVTWTITARQNGPAGDVYVSDALGPDFNYVSHSATPALTAVSTGTTFSGYWPQVTLGEVVTLTLVTALVGTPATTPTNSASFTTTNHLTPTATTPGQPQCGGQACRYYPSGVQPSIHKSGVSETPYTAGSVVTWTIVATNNGGADHFYVTDELEPEFTYISHSASPPLAETISTSPTFRGRWETIGAGEVMTLTLVTALSGSTDGLTPTNRATLTSTSYLTPTTGGPVQSRCGGQPCPFKTPAVSLSPASQSKTGLPGQTLSYALTLANAGTLADDIDLNITSPWSAGLVPGSPAAVPGESSVPLTLNVSIPAGAISGTVVSSYLTATSGITTAAMDMAEAVSVVGLDSASGIAIAPITVTPSPLTGIAGTPITLTHPITNTANYTDIVNLTITPPAGWPAGVTVAPLPPFNLGPGEQATVTIILTVPISATLHPTEPVTVTVWGELGAAPNSVQDTFELAADPDGDADGDGILNRYEDRDRDGLYNDDDSDGDGLPDYLDVDDDNDGVWTVYEYPDINGDGNPADGLNTDGDSLKDYLDPNDDNDPWLTRDEGADPNGDGDPADAIDRDGDRIPSYLDVDEGSASDTDADGDGIPDDVECSTSPCEDSDDDGTPDYLDTDSDDDGVLDEYEYDQDGNDVADDTDGDGRPDWRDGDDDGDGVPTAGEQADPNGDGDPADAVDSDGDDIPDFLDADDGGGGFGGGDSDMDGIVDSIECENGAPCPDSDDDGTPDYLDPDSDNDGVYDRWEFDRNRDGRPDDTDLDGTPDFRDGDDDGDGIGTAAEQADPNGDGDPADAVDSDGNGLPDYLDPGEVSDADGDGIPDNVECPGAPCRDSDGDGTPDWQDTDSDDDGVLDRYECPDGQLCRDTDGDGAPDYRDFDDDGDGVLTLLEEADPNGDGDPADAVDSDGDGIADYLDADDEGDPGGDGGDSDGDGIPDGAECTEEPCEDTDSDGTPDYMTPVDEPGAPHVYLRLSENETVAWAGIMTTPVAIDLLPAARVQPDQVLTYTVYLANSGGLSTTTTVTTTFSAGLDTSGQTITQTELAAGGAYTLTYPARRVAATETMTLTVRFETQTMSGTQVITIYKSLDVNDEGVYLPLIIKEG